jgi:hypothetical protein
MHHQWRVCENAIQSWVGVYVDVNGGGDVLSTGGRPCKVAMVDVAAGVVEQGRTDEVLIDW